MPQKVLCCYTLCRCNLTDKYWKSMEAWLWPRTNIPVRLITDNPITIKSVQPSAQQNMSHCCQTRRSATSLCASDACSLRDLQKLNSRCVYPIGFLPHPRAVRSRACKNTCSKHAFMVQVPRHWWCELCRCCAPIARDNSLYLAVCIMFDWKSASFRSVADHWTDMHTCMGKPDELSIHSSAMSAAVFPVTILKCSLVSLLCTSNHCVSWKIFFSAFW